MYFCLPKCTLSPAGTTHTHCTILHLCLRECAFTPAGIPSACLRGSNNFSYSIEALKKPTCKILHFCLSECTHASPEKKWSVLAKLGNSTLSRAEILH